MILLWLLRSIEGHLSWNLLGLAPSKVLPLVLGAILVILSILLLLLWLQSLADLMHSAVPLLLLQLRLLLHQEDPRARFLYMDEYQMIT